MSYIILLGTLGLVLLASHLIYRKWLHPLAAIPGPFLCSVSYLPFLYKGAKGTWAKKMIDLHQIYGSVVRVGPNHVAVDGFAYETHLHTARPGKTQFDKVSGFFSGDNLGIIGAPTSEHRRQRRQLASGFSKATVSRKSDIIVSHANQLMRVLRERTAAASTGASGQSTATLDLATLMLFTTFDIATQLIWSRSGECLTNDAQHEWAQSGIKSLQDSACTRFQQHFAPLPPLLVNRIFGLPSAKGPGSSDMSWVREKTQERIRQQDNYRDGDPSGDFISHMLRKTTDGNPGVDEAEIVSSTPLIVIAGSETSATALSALWFLLLQDPEAYTKVCGEVRSAFIADAEINNETVEKLDYLRACIEEALRFHPPVAEIPPRICPGVEIEGKFIPPGTLISTFPLATSHNPVHFTRPKSFIPERWILSESELAKLGLENDTPEASQPFGYGARDCLGKHFAYAEMLIIAAKMAYSFDMELVQGQQGWIEKQVAFCAWAKPPLWIKIWPRV